MTDLHGGSAGSGADGTPATPRRGRRVRPGAVPDAHPPHHRDGHPDGLAGDLGLGADGHLPAAATPSAPDAPVQDHVVEAHPDQVPADGVHAEDAYTEDAYTEEAYTEEAYTEEAYTEEAYTEEAYTEDAYTEDAYAEDPHAEDASADEADVEDETYLDDVHPDDVHPDDVHPDQGVDEHDLTHHAGYRVDRRPRRRGRTAVVLVVCLALLGGAVYAGWAFLSPIIDRVSAGTAPAEDFPGPGSGQVDVVVDPGDTGGAIGDALLEAGVVASRAAFVSEFTATPAAASLQPGTYRLRTQMKASDALALLLDPAARQSIRVVVREGLWVSELLPEISAETGFPVEELQAALADPAIGLPAEAGGQPEGYLFPATYDLAPDVTPVEMFTAMVARHDEAMDGLGVPAEQRRDVLVRASIAQGEASRTEDLAKVARVIQNRLDRGEVLGMDSTVGYVVQKRALDLTASDLETDSPYNTRINTGLPPGPINNPGEAAIAAALAPAEGDWLYFVTVDGDTGETVFTADYDEFLAAKQQFQEWLAANG